MTVKLDELKISTETDVPCAHCGSACGSFSTVSSDRTFCCIGCSRVYALLHDLGMEAYYELLDTKGAKPVQTLQDDRYTLLEQEQIWQRLLDHQQGSVCRTTFRIPAIHCTSCVWLLENLYSLVDGLGRIEVDILRKEARVDFDCKRISLADVARELERFGYPPEISLGSLDSMGSPEAPPDRLLLKIGVAGFAFGNTMLFHFPGYFGMESGVLSNFFSMASLILSIPVVLFSASDYWRNSWRDLKRFRLGIEVPIALGLCALFVQSLVDVLSKTGPGYLDSLCGLVFFMLLGRWYQRRTTDALTFDRDYRSYFPMMARRIEGEQETPVVVTSLKPGDRISIRPGELIPADAILVRGEGHVDYSFVTGESLPETRRNGDTLYAGGRQTGSRIVVDVIKPVSQSYLTSLWNDAAFKVSSSRLTSLTDATSRIFTPLVVLIAFGTLAYWWGLDARMALTSAVAVLIVACPCALALSAPFAFGQAMRILGRNNVYVRSSNVVESLGRISHILFDKTGTLTESHSQRLTYTGLAMDAATLACVHAVADQSTHPLSRRLSATIGNGAAPLDVSGFDEVAGKGVEGTVAGRVILIGSETWMLDNGISVSPGAHAHAHVHGPGLYVAIDDRFVGAYHVEAALRHGMKAAVKSLAHTYRLGVLTGDQASGTAAVAAILPEGHPILSAQSPRDKLNWVKALQQDNAVVAMVGDGLNDAGALQQSDVGIAVTEDVHAFTPSCDAILDASVISHLPAILRFARHTRHIVIFSFCLSIMYNLVGFSLATTGRLTPVLAAILMPLSSITIVCVATLGTRFAARTEGMKPA